MNPARAGTSDEIRRRLLALPAGDSFWYAVFEVWLFVRISRALTALGYPASSPSTALHQVGSSDPARVHSDNARTIEVWFQRASPIGQGRWRDEEGTSLRGIPDVVLTTQDRAPMLLDAKFRWSGDSGRSDEIYKMLGYAENFASRFRETGFNGLVAFPGEASSTRHLVGPRSGTLALVTYAGEDEWFDSTIRHAVGTWLEARSSSSHEEGTLDEDAEDHTAALANAQLNVLQAQAAQLLDTAHRALAETRLREILGHCWNEFDEISQAMLITGWALGERFDRTAVDWSGPVLALLAACERLARDRLTLPIAATSAQAFEDQHTFGRIAWWLRHSRPQDTGPEAEAIRTWVANTPGADLAALSAVGRKMTELSSLRNQAAHVDLVPPSGWERTVQRVLIADRALATLICAALPA